MEELSIKEILKLLTEGGLLSVAAYVTYILVKKFVEKEVVGRIDETQTLAKRAQESANEAKYHVEKASLKMVETVGGMQTDISKSLGEMTKVFTESSRFAASAHMKASQIESDLKSHEAKTDERFVRTAQALKLRQDEIKGVKTEVQKLSEDVVLIKTKKGSGNDSSGS